MSLISYRLLASSFIMAFCSLSYEFMAAQMMSALMGNTLFFYCLTVGIYIFALGIGSLFPVRKLVQDQVEKRIFWVEVGICVLGGWAPIWLFGIDYLASISLADHATMVRISCTSNLLLVTMIGLLSGMELPLLLKLDEIRTRGRRFMQVLALDYIASFIGAIAFPLWFYREWGLVKSANFFGILNLCAVLILLPNVVRERRGLFFAGVFSCLAVFFLMSDHTTMWLSQKLYAYRP